MFQFCRVSVLVLLSLLTVSTTGALAQVDVDRLAQRLEKLEAENEALKLRLRRLERVETPVKVVKVEASAATAPIATTAPPPLKAVKLEPIPFEGAYALAFGSLMTGNMELATFRRYDSNLVVLPAQTFVDYSFPNNKMRSMGFGFALGYNFVVTERFLFGVEARASVPRWTYVNGIENGYKTQYPHLLQSGTCYYSGPCVPVLSNESQIAVSNLVQDRFKLGANSDLSFRPGAIIWNSLLFGRVGFGIQHAEQINTHTNIIETCTSPQYAVTGTSNSYSVSLAGCAASRVDASQYIDKVSTKLPYLVFGGGIEHDLGPAFLRVEVEARSFFKADSARVRMWPGLSQRVNAGVGMRF